jgi:tRNA (guanine26-N2/guanine27-N2)-dimethyltransferase
MGYVLHCFTCLHREHSKGIFSPVKRICPVCGSRIRVAGPLWLGKISDEEFCSLTEKELRGRTLKNLQIIHKLLSLSKNEADASPTYYVTDRIGDTLNLPLPSLLKVITELRKIGFHATRTHFSSSGIRTNAPSTVVKEVVTSLAA